ncbi:MAG: type II toxin-antitoxin system HicA family toxin [Lachnospiraceae bacterium]|nr:type II toxin-antitoxin system HicA family toxin [Lachnospiraceae bacterium]
MSQKEKLISKLKSNPKDFTFDEAETLLGYLTFRRSNKGKTSGSRVMFTSDAYSAKITLHKPHPRKELRDYQIDQLIEMLEQEGLI